ncbi:HCLS1-associated protein X-1 [Chanos chanos]|uniref:HCLS1-associated protein X-1 n=1 Tax=Chanos chanos TaxID=29144 RepID=A0A6J2WKU5_CHACN|nr:HCLS1-associated protein X-1 [Chanos chanos]
MSIFDLFRGFFGVPGGHYSRRDPFFDGMTHDDDDDDEDEEDDGVYFDSFRRSDRDPFDDSVRFGFSFGPNGMRFQEPRMFGQIFQEMEEIFDRLGQFDEMHRSGRIGERSIEAPPPQEGAERGRSGNTLRDFMLKTPDSSSPGRSPSAPVAPREDTTPPEKPLPPHIPKYPFSKFHDFWRDGPLREGKEEKKEDGDLDSQVSSGGLDQILTPAPSQPKSRSFFQSVTVTKVVKPDGTVEETRTVRDSEGNVESTVTRSTGPEGGQDSPGPVIPGGSRPFMDVWERFFGGFRS